MCKKLLTFVVVLSMVSVAFAIDTFETYPDTAALQTRWIDVSVDDQGDASGASSAVGTLVVGSPPLVCEGAAAMNATFTLTGGWVYPNALPPWDPGYVKKQWEAIADRAKIQLNLIHPINIAAYGNMNWSLQFDIKPMSDSIGDLGDLNIYGYGKDKDGKDVFARTLIPCLTDMTQNSLQWWYPADYVPAIVGPSIDLTGTPWEGLPVIPVGEWGKIIINDDHELNWNWGNVPWNDIVSLESLVIEINSDTDMTTDMRELEGGDKYPIKGGVYPFAFDNFEFIIVPEPTTIALLGLGSLAMLRRKRAK